MVTTVLCAAVQLSTSRLISLACQGIRQSLVSFLLPLTMPGVCLNFTPCTPPCLMLTHDVGRVYLSLSIQPIRLCGIMCNIWLSCDAPPAMFLAALHAPGAGGQCSTLSDICMGKDRCIFKLYSTVPTNLTKCCLEGDTVDGE